MRGVERVEDEEVEGGASPAPGGNQALYLTFITPVVYDFYNYDMEKAEFVQLFIKFTQNVALFGALLFFLGMKNSIPKRQAKKKASKSKTN